MAYKHWLSSCIKSITTFGSLYTDMALRKLIQKALTLLSFARLSAANRELEREISDVHDEIRLLKQAEIASKQSDICYRAIVEDQTEVIARYLPDGTLTFFNQAFALYYGRSPEELIGSPDQPMILEADRQRVAEFVALISADHPVVIIENRVLLGDRVRWTKWHNRMVFDEQGCFLEFQSVGYDITDFKEIEEKLFQEKELAQVTLQSIGDGVLTTDVFRRIQYLNPVAKSLLGCSEASAEGLLLGEVFDIVHEMTREKVQNPIEEALQENRIVSLANHTVLINQNDREIAIQDSAAPIHNREGQIIGGVMVFRDVTQNAVFTSAILAGNP
ncbi:PAS domain-containing protein [Nostoc sp. UCD121]|uniref:PAS domain-containing protein n=1 Tax=unclassified Nostoc TaxID=2593658 RepID=UPI0016299A6F|nr:MULTISPECIES: PAS domain-containing protein [unclassified Nostoc]MBC1223036.1 PAS domain-containing protein [Nostoc sp. UCD120]MBC1274980.1 PAS domain-containing protein [Nostoc sp. UCD121]MBC1297122.1 PAS domain-containing protein [Nostoc sp. UCD122]